jgi:hypothetical protein
VAEFGELTQLVTRTWRPATTIVWP